MKNKVILPSTQQLLSAAYAINAAYILSESSKSFKRPDAYELVTNLVANPPGFSSELETFGYIEYYTVDDSVTIVFRGTNSFDDWVTNSDHAQLKHSDYSVHHGYDKLYNQMDTAIKHVVNSLPKVKKINVYGHSLGGGLAIDCLLNLRISFPNLPANAITFASPRLLDIRGAEKLNHLAPNNYRVFNTEDLVPTLPLAVLGHRNYAHAGIPLAFTLPKGDIKPNHAMETYIDGIKTLNLQENYDYE
jgi:triacylglycerol lipase